MTAEAAHPSWLSGGYELVRHDPHTFYNGERDADGEFVGINRPETITLQPDGRVTSGGAVSFFDTPEANLPRSTDGPAVRGTGGCWATAVPPACAAATRTWRSRSTA